MTLPGALLPWIELRFLNDVGEPLAGGFVESYVAGTDTPQVTYTDSDLSVANPVVIELDANGRPPDPIYLGTTAGYKFIVKDADDVVIYTFDDVEDPATLFLSNLGVNWSVGSSVVTDGYTITSADTLVTVNSAATNPTVINLPAAADFPGVLIVKNLGANPVDLTPDGTDTIDTVNAAFTIAAAATPVFPSLFLMSNGVSAWFIVASHGL